MLNMQPDPKGVTVHNSLWEESVRSWRRSMCVWCCLAAGVVTMAQNYPTEHRLALASGSLVEIARSAIKPVQLNSPVTHSSVALRYERLDLSAYAAADYGDHEY